MDKPEADVIISWFSSGQVAADAFTRPTKFVQLPTPDGQKYDQMLSDIAMAMGSPNQPLRAVLKKYAPDIRPARIALLGFSEGCQGVRSMLRSPDARRIDSVIAIDGIHAQFQPGSHTTLNPAYLTAYAAFARMAADGARLMIDTTSSIVPPYPTVSTTDTAAWIWREATGEEEGRYDNALPEGVAPQVFEPPVVLKAGQSGPLVWPTTTYEQAPLKRYMNKGSLWIFNYSNLDPTGHNDHILQAQQILPLMLTRFLAERWNKIAPSEGICVLGDETAPVTGCFKSTRLSDLYLDGGAEPDPLEMDFRPDATIPDIKEPDHAPPPPVGSDTGGGDDTPTQVLKWGAGIIAGTLFLEGARRFGEYLAKRPPHLPFSHSK